MVAAVGLRLAALLCVLWVQSATAEWGKGGKGNWGSKDCMGAGGAMASTSGRDKWTLSLASKRGSQSLSSWMKKSAGSLAAEIRLPTPPQLVPHRSIGARTEKSNLQRDKSTKSWKNSGHSVMLPWKRKQKLNKPKTDGTRTEAASWASGCGNSTSCEARQCPCHFASQVIRTPEEACPEGSDWPRGWVCLWILGRFVPCRPRLWKPSIGHHFEGWVVGNTSVPQRSC